MRHHGSIHAERGEQLVGGVVAHFLLAVVHRRNFNDDGKVTTGLYRDRHHRHLDAENLRVFAVHAHAVVDLRRIPDLQIDAHVDFLLQLNGAHTENATGVDDADAAQLDEVADVLRGLTDERFAGYAANFHRIVRDETVAALDKLDGRLALADAAVADKQNTFAVNLHQNAVACDARRKLDVQIRNERRDNI